MSTRRQLLQGLLKSSALATGSFALNPLALGCAGVQLKEQDFGPAGKVTLGLHPSASLENDEDAVHRTLENVDFSWLTPGNSVFVKLACNSPHLHPAVTSPTAVRAMVKALKARGAGNVLVGDQSGVASVRLVAGEKRYSSTRRLMRGNGLLAAIKSSGAEAHFFDDGGFEAGYIAADLDLGSSGWSRPPMLARVITEVDHVVYLPRISSHLMTGYTAGHKISVGFMRDDTRHDMHWKASDIFEKYTEVNYCRQLRDKLRLVVTYADAILANGGPDQGQIVAADPRVVIASNHLANHDAVVVTLLNHAQENLTVTSDTGGIPYGPWAGASNAAMGPFVEAQTGFPWTSEAGFFHTTYVPHSYGNDVKSDRALSRAYELLGGVPRSIAVEVVGEKPSPALAQVFARYGSVQVTAHRTSV